MMPKRLNSLNSSTLPPDAALLKNPTAMRYLRSIWIFMPGAADLEPIVTAFPVGESEARLKTHLTSGPYRRTAAHMVTLLANVWTKIDNDDVAGYPDPHLQACRDGLANLQVDLSHGGPGYLIVNLGHVETWFGQEVATSVRAILLDVQKELQAQ